MLHQLFPSRKALWPAVPNLLPFFQLPKCCFSSIFDGKTSIIDGGESLRPHHPWPEWVSFVDNLKNKGYITDDSGISQSNASASLYKSINRLEKPCIRFARDRFDIINSLSKIDIGIVVQKGCPRLISKVVISAKRLRAYVGLDEGDVCCSCDQRDSCDSAYVISMESEAAARTVDIVRVLMWYALDGLVTETRPCNKLIVAPTRKLLNQITEMSDSPLDPALPRPVFRVQKKETLDYVEPATNTMFQEGDWYCPECNYHNYARNVRCIQCHADGIERTSAVAIEMKTGDWYCQQCKMLNFRNSERCMRCRIARPGLLSRTGYWGCSMCGSMNFKVNARCLKCNNERPQLQT